MNNKYLKTALISGLFCLPVVSQPAFADVTPEQFNLLVTAAQKDGGKDFETLVKLLIAAHPEDEAEIIQVAQQIRSNNPPVAAAANAPAETASADAVEGTIFSDNGATWFSKIFLPGWDKEIEINALYSTGNTSQKSFGTATKFEREAGPFHQAVTTYFDFNRSNGITNQRRYGIAYKTDYSINDISYITGYSSFEGTSFGAFNKRFTFNAGYGLHVLDNDKFQWNVEAGPAILITKPLSGAGYDTVLTAYASSLFSWIINDRSELGNESKIYIGNRMVIENKTDFKVQISGALSGKISFDVLYNRDAPIGRKKTDTITRIGILYDF